MCCVLIFIPGPSACGVRSASARRCWPRYGRQKGRGNNNKKKKNDNNDNNNNSNDKNNDNNMI